MSESAVLLNHHTLPPSLEGKLQGYLHLRITGRLINKYSHVNVGAAVKWWGESDFVKLWPGELKTGSKSFTYKYDIRTSKKLLDNYLKDCKFIRFNFIDNQCNTLLGIVEIKNVTAAITQFGKQINYPILDIFNLTIGDVTIEFSIKLKEFLNKSSIPHIKLLADILEDGKKLRAAMMTSVLEQTTPYCDFSLIGESGTGNVLLPLCHSLQRKSDAEDRRPLINFTQIDSIWADILNKSFQKVSLNEITDKISMASVGSPEGSQHSSMSCYMDVLQIDVTLLKIFTMGKTKILHDFGVSERHGSLFLAKGIKYIIEPELPKYVEGDEVNDGKKLTSTKYESIKTSNKGAVFNTSTLHNIEQIHGHGQDWLNKQVICFVISVVSLRGRKKQFGRAFFQLSDLLDTETMSSKQQIPIIELCPDDPVSSTTSYALGSTTYGHLNVRIALRLDEELTEEETVQQLPTEPNIYLDRLMYISHGYNFQAKRLFLKIESKVSNIEDVTEECEAVDSVHHFHVYRKSTLQLTYDMIKQFKLNNLTITVWEIGEDSKTSCIGFLAIPLNCFHANYKNHHTLPDVLKAQEVVAAVNSTQPVLDPVTHQNVGYIRVLLCWGTTKQILRKEKSIGIARSSVELRFSSPLHCSSASSRDATLSPTPPGGATLSPTPPGGATLSPTPPGDATLSPKLPGNATLSPIPSRDATLSPTPSRDATLSPTPSRDGTLRPTSPGDAPFSPASSGDAPYSPASSGDAPYSPASSGNAPYSPASSGNAPYSPASLGDAPFSPALSGYATLSSASPRDAAFSPASSSPELLNTSPLRPELLNRSGSLPLSTSPLSSSPETDTMSQMEESSMEIDCDSADDDPQSDMSVDSILETSPMPQILEVLTQTEFEHAPLQTPGPLSGGHLQTYDKPSETQAETKHAANEGQVTKQQSANINPSASGNLGVLEPPPDTTDRVNRKQQYSDFLEIHSAVLERNMSVDWSNDHFYVRLHVKNDKTLVTELESGTNPEWRWQSLVEFNVDKNGKIIFQVMRSANSAVPDPSRDEVFGTASINFAQRHRDRSSCDVWYNLLDTNAKWKGRIKIIITQLNYDQSPYPSVTNPCKMNAAPMSSMSTGESSHGVLVNGVKHADTTPAGGNETVDQEDAPGDSFAGSPLDGVLRTQFTKFSAITRQMKRRLDDVTNEDVQNQENVHYGNQTTAIPNEACALVIHPNAAQNESDNLENCGDHQSKKRCTEICRPIEDNFDEEDDNTSEFDNLHRYVLTDNSFQNRLYNIFNPERFHNILHAENESYPIEELDPNDHYITVECSKNDLGEVIWHRRSPEADNDCVVVDTVQGSVGMMESVAEAQTLLVDLTESPDISMDSLVLNRSVPFAQEAPEGGSVNREGYIEHEPTAGVEDMREASGSGLVEGNAHQGNVHLNRAEVKRIAKIFNSK